MYRALNVIDSGGRFCLKISQGMRRKKRIHATNSALSEKYYSK